MVSVWPPALEPAGRSILATAEHLVWWLESLGGPLITIATVWQEHDLNHDGGAVSPKEGSLLSGFTWPADTVPTQRWRVSACYWLSTPGPWSLGQKHTRPGSAPLGAVFPVLISFIKVTFGAGYYSKHLKPLCYNHKFVNNQKWALVNWL